MSTSVLDELVARSRAIGADPSLVVWGGGNTSAKGVLADHLGRERRVMWIKGSGSDLAGATPGDFPALYLDDLVALRRFDSLDDDTMVDYVARAIVDPAARRPSIETLLHAFIPATHIDHVHADAVCTLTNHLDGAGAVKEALGEGFVYVDWVRPGFALSKIAGDLSDCGGIVLAHHGLVTWAETSADCLARTRAAVARVEAYLDARSVRPPATARSVPDLTDAQVHELLLRLRGHLGAGGRRVLRVDRRLRAVADRADLDAVARAGVATGDHMMRIKPWSAVLSEPTDAARAIDDVERYAAAYHDYFERHRAELLPDGYAMHDPRPRVVLVPGLGAITTGADRREAEVLADIALHTHTVGARVLDLFEPSTIPEAETFAFDYWPMELYKLTLKPPPPPFSGTVVVVTGAASGIGRGIARELGSLGASLCLADLDAEGLAACADELVAAGAPEPITVPGDQADEAVVEATMRETVRHFGGADGLVACAGVGVTGALRDLTIDAWERSLRVNLTSAFLLTRHAMRSFAVQGSGGSIVYVASKNAFAPGSEFGAYSVAKAGLVQLMRIAALEGGAHGIRANAVNPDAVFDGSRLWDEGLREERAAAHGIDPGELETFYAERNLLGRRVTASDVAHSVAFLLSDESSRTTGAVIGVDGGVPAAFPR